LVKAVLNALADRCWDDGTDAFPSVATIAAQVEISIRTTHRCLDTLRHLGLIAEQAPPRQHRPRTWRLNLEAIRALDPKTAAQYVAALSSPGAQPPPSDVQVRDADAQDLNTDAHAVAEDPSVQIPSLIPPVNGAPSALNSRAKTINSITPEIDREAVQRHLEELNALKVRLGFASTDGDSNEQR
jgi:hypothetical protein